MFESFKFSTFKRFPKIILESDQDSACREWSLMKLEYVDTTYIDPKDSSKKLKVMALDFWTKIFSLRTITGDIKYPLIAKIVQFIIILPFGTASVERDFSLVNIIKSRLRNSLKTETLCALLRVREMVSEDITAFEPDREMFELYNSEMYDHVKETDESIEFLGGDEIRNL